MYFIPSSEFPRQNSAATRGMIFALVLTLTLRRLMSYIYIYMEHPFLMFLDHTQRRTTSVGLLWTSDQLVAETST